MEPKLQSLTLLGTRRVVPLEHFIALNVPSPNFSTTSQADFNYHTAKKHRRAKITSKFKICLEEFSGFYRLREHRSSQHQIAIRATNLDMDSLLENIDDTELELGRKALFLQLIPRWLSAWKKEDNVFLNAQSHPSTIHFSTRCLITCSTNWDVQPKSTLHSDLFWKTLKMERVDTFMQRSKFVCTPDDMVNLNKKLQEVDTCRKERTNTKWRNHKLTNVTVFCFVTQRYTHAL